MGSFIVQEVVLLRPEKVSKLVIYGETCGTKEGVHRCPQNPEVVRILTDFVNNRAQSIDKNKILSVTVPTEWLKSHLGIKPSTI